MNFSTRAMIGAASALTMIAPACAETNPGVSARSSWTQEPPTLETVDPASSTSSTVPEEVVQEEYQSAFGADQSVDNLRADMTTYTQAVIHLCFQHPDFCQIDYVNPYEITIDIDYADPDGYEVELFAQTTVTKDYPDVDPNEELVVDKPEVLATATFTPNGAGVGPRLIQGAYLSLADLAPLVSIRSGEEGDYTDTFASIEGEGDARFRFGHVSYTAGSDWNLMAAILISDQAADTIKATTDVLKDLAS